MTGTQTDKLRSIIAPVVEKDGYDLEELQAITAGRRLVIRVTVDTDGGVSLDDIAEVSRTVSAVLEENENTDGLLDNSPYTLEVSSPGIDRPLTLPRHWRRNIGRKVAVPVGEVKIEGRIIAADERGIEMEVDGDTRLLTFSEIGPGRVSIDI